MGEDKDLFSVGASLVRPRPDCALHLDAGEAGSTAAAAPLEFTQQNPNHDVPGTHSLRLLPSPSYIVEITYPVNNTTDIALRSTIVKLFRVPFSVEQRIPARVSFSSGNSPL